MIRRTHAPLFGGMDQQAVEDADPRVGLVNLADIMLVLAAAIMVALLSHFGAVAQPEEQSVALNEQAMEAISDDSKAKPADEVTDDEGNYEEAGKVYRDKDTGDLYLVPNEGA